MDCRHNKTDTFSLFVTTYLLPQTEIRKRANLYQNFLNKDGTPKSRSGHKIRGRYTLDYLQDKIKNRSLKKKFHEIREYIRNVDPTIQEEYTKRRLVYWDSSNRCLYNLEPHRKSLWIGINGKIEVKSLRKYSGHNKTYFLIKKNSDAEKILTLL